MGGKGKKGVAAIEKQQARQQQEAAAREKEKKRQKKDEKGGQKQIYVTNDAYQELVKAIKPGSYYTLYELASKFNIPLGLARRAVNDMRSQGKLVQVSRSRNSQLFLAT
ncbi:MAG: hypothetical protein M1357_02140 [Candidatus Marsarchaeota archaeon]|nr:hypothetical protein [Candidatus Marsarchaeota archaeon]